MKDDEYDRRLNKVKLSLAWLNANATHAIELCESFTFPAHDSSLRKTIEVTNNNRCYKAYLEAIYFEFIMTLMRMYDNYKSDDTICFEKIFQYLSADFVHDFENKSQRKVKNKIQSVLIDYKSLNNSHLVARLKTVRDRMFAHTSAAFNRSQVAKYGYAEELLEKTLPMLNNLNSAFHDKVEPFDTIRKYWKGYATTFWKTFLIENG